MKKEKNKKEDKARPKIEKRVSQHIKGENFYRDAKKVKWVRLLKSGKAKRNKKGKIIKPGEFQSKDIPDARIQPDRRWFNNTRVISQDVLNMFRESFTEKLNDPYKVLLRQNKLPVSLLREPTKTRKANIIDVEPFDDTFGPKSKRKRTKLYTSSMENLSNFASESYENYIKKNCEYENVNKNIQKSYDKIFSKGTSKRIWNELYKVIDSSDVIIQLLDARNPLGTRCKHIEEYLKKEKPHKHMIFLLNKCDLIPTWCTREWIKQLSKEYPTLAFHASINNPFGKGSLIQLLRQFSKLHSNRRQISVGFIGYPNTGKSSVINTLKSKKVCNTAPIPGETKVWQYVRMTSKIFMIDCPGIVPPNSNDSETEIIIKGVLRIEKVSNPEQYIRAILNLCETKHLERTYQISGWENDSTKFLELLAQKTGKLLKGGETDESSIAKMVINDFIRGKIPWFIAPVQESKLSNIELSNNTLVEKTI
ncbi:nucleolar GTP-binding protein 2 [Pneumocystis murina B123]|uniref:Nucleolar GTP-binding protein 2 n=1 Tax=Pneumocystis murina (strain B123) TaxID=1069680 RepID=M7NNC6_PNEMU|nr:nucleolar GTP-binding protein 2 [Pneumocystis murina B123]EMR08621.1 nucleolar GTP-binding protein 2 [Pneumocystis murina B123]